MEDNKKDLLPVRSIGFWEAVRLAFSQYATFSGRATRKEYFYYLLFNLAVSGILYLLLMKIVLIGEDNYIHQYLRRICYESN